MPNSLPGDAVATPIRTAPARQSRMQVTQSAQPRTERAHASTVSTSVTIGRMGKALRADLGRAGRKTSRLIFQILACVPQLHDLPP